MDEEKNESVENSSSNTQQFVVVVVAAAVTFLTKKAVEKAITAGFEAYQNRKTTDTE